MLGRYFKKRLASYSHILHILRLLRLLISWTAKEWILYPYAPYFAYVLSLSWRGYEIFGITREIDERWPFPTASFSTDILMDEDLQFLQLTFRIGYSLSRQCLSIYQKRLLPLVDNSNPDQPPVPSANNYPIYIHYCSSWDAIDVLDGAH